MIKLFNKTKFEMNKKMKFLSIVMVVAAFASVFSSCEKDDDTNDPETVIAVTSPTDGGSQVSGTTIPLTFTANSDNGLKRVVVKFKSAIGVEVTKLDTLLAAQPTAFSFSRNYTVGSVGTETYTISVTDKKDNIVTRSVNVKSITGFDVELFGKFYHILGTKIGAYDLIKNEERIITDSDNDKDMVNNDVAGVFTGGWVAKNSTLFVKANGFNYNTGTINDAKNVYSAGLPKNNMALPVNGDIYVAKLRGTETYAIIKIIANDLLNDECGCTNKGKLTFNFRKSL